MSFHSNSNTPSNGYKQNSCSNASTAVHYSEQHICCVNVLPTCSSEHSNESTPSSNRNVDVKPSGYLASLHSNPGPECSILPSNDPKQSNESTFSSNRSEDVKPFLASESSTPGSILTNSSAECNGNVTIKTMATPQESQVVQNTVGIVSQPGQSSDLPLDRNGFNKAEQSTVQLATAIPSLVRNNSLQGNKYVKQVHSSGVKPLSTQPIFFFSTNELSTKTIGKNHQPTNQPSAVSLVANAPLNHIPSTVNHKFHPDFQHLVTKVNENRLPTLPSSGHLPSGNWSSAYRKILPNVHYVVTKGNTNGLPTNLSSGNVSSGNLTPAYRKVHPDFQHLVAKINRSPTGNPSSGNMSSGSLSSGNMSSGNLSLRNLSYGNLSSGNLSLGNLSLGNLSSGNMSSGNVSSGDLTPFYHKVHPDFQHLVANTNRSPIKHPLNTSYSQPEEKPHKCSKCSLRFSSEEDCSRHFPVHHKKCPYCSEVFSSSAPYRELLKHVVLFHKDKDPCSLAHKSTVISALRGSTPGHFRCCHCGGEFDSLRACLEHRVYSHMVKECWVCQKTFSTMDRLKNHIKTHTGEKAYPCPYCPKSFATSSTRASHVRRHTGQVYRCEHCSFMTADKAYLELHQNKHTGAKPYKCQYCPMAYGQPGRLKIHERSHTGEKPYPCDQCDKAFIDKYSLVRHVRTHTGEKPYKCTYCDKGFAQGCQLQFHERTHTGEKPYECSHCEKRFTRRQELNKHLETHEKRKRESKRKMVEEDSDLEYSADDVDNEDREERLASLRSTKQSTKKRRCKS